MIVGIRISGAHNLGVYGREKGFSGGAPLVHDRPKTG